MHPKQYSMVWIAWYTTVSAKSNCKENTENYQSCKTWKHERVAGWGKRAHYLVLLPRTACLKLNTDTVFSGVSMSVL